ncbi:gem-associated protein 2 [Monomorium pharaonis]|uniref:gem-associated protein 2 n=1 Tax=Monomorium pharaonis TaxID=307658 RepID=UPI00063F66C7|nr:gem-associated protein 2 [Monomorium pharaonis]XP_036149992.1 gem-associated protein 2-like [Monomorium pharaonis]XP_036149993.1 gem-associated protein 2-like [Monomorium pharaonis]XP_036150560.1 gem-associated protein 2 [Monomorium pharaonis]XP_036150562.1 gem-associated protein 2 [Monomorium pharaonis]
MDCLKQQAFLVGDIDEDINLSLPPSSGEEYIKRVVIEARQCADVVVADLDPSCVKQPTKAYVKTLAGCVQAPANLKPTIEWQQYQVSDFSKLRLYVSQLKNEILIGKRKWRPPDINLPDINDQNAWVSFCLGAEEKIEPTLNTLFCFNQSNIEQVLEHLVQFVETERRIEYKIGQWIYTLLAILEQPLQPDTCSCLRSLARACSVIRVDSRELDAQELGALNLFICLVARYFRQLDLADP